MQNAKRLYMIAETHFESYNKIIVVAKLLSIKHGLVEPTKRNSQADLAHDRPEVQEWLLVCGEQWKAGLNYRGK